MIPESAISRCPEEKPERSNSLWGPESKTRPAVCVRSAIHPSCMMVTEQDRGSQQGFLPAVPIAERQFLFVISGSVRTAVALMFENGVRVSVFKYDLAAGSRPPRQHPLPGT